MKKIIVSLLIFSLLIVFVTLNPWLYFHHCLEYKNFRVYSDFQLPENAYSVLDEAEEMIMKSDFYDPDLKFKIFVRSDFDSYSWVPLHFTRGYGQAIPIIQNVFISKADFETNKAYTAAGFQKDDSRILAKVLAHELSHVLVNHDSYTRWARSIFKKSDWSDLGLLWKDEGYAEYIAGEWNEDVALEILNESSGDSVELSVYEVEYCTCWMAVKYLLESRHMTIAEILESDIDVETVLAEIRKTRNANLLSEVN